MKRYQHNQNMFLFLIPILILFIAFIFDFVLIYVQYKRLEVATKQIIEESFDYNVIDHYKKASDVYTKHKINYDNLDINYIDNEIVIYNSYSYPSFFGKILGKNSYRSEISIKGYLENDSLIFEEVQNE